MPAGNEDGKRHAGAKVKEKLEDIPKLLDGLEIDLSVVESSIPDAGLGGLELPGLIQDIVDFLQPELKPYEFAF